ncbi:MAG: radical SAM family heme chaperone HemW [Zoogloeaceae bacterium]|jgi:oxygen-independent coproporphyrinogen-3 oxidase|nr:radical SAM family heme chaperone HemW [Zoogloeaceae bacterium]
MTMRFARGVIDHTRSRVKELPPCALYVHIPWCIKKCPYCDFNSHALADALPEANDLAALLADLDSARSLLSGRTFASVFFGGGTPSLLAPATVGTLLTHLSAQGLLTTDAEITLEANPGTLTEALGEEKLTGFRAAGVNRLSLGIQSFQDAPLAALGRIHDGRAARQAVALATRIFARVNLDLMYGLPGQGTVAAALDDVETALCFAPQHLSCYQLTLEPNTRFAAFPPPNLPDEDQTADMGDALAARLAAAGYQHYETSAWAQPGGTCRHNLNYWRFGDYLGIGAGAHSKLTRLAPEAAGGLAVFRAARPRNPAIYRAQATTPAAWTEVPADERPFEFLLNALRLAEGFTPAHYAARTGLPFADLLPRLQTAEAAGLLTCTPERVVPTAQGRRFLNRLLTLLT